MSLIDSLKNEGVLQLYMDFRSGSFKDFSGNDHDGTPNGTFFTRKGSFVSGSDNIQVADTAGLQLTSGTLVCFGDMSRVMDNGRMISKRDAGGTNYELYCGGGADNYRFYDGSTESVLITARANRYIGVNFESGSAPTFYKDGISAGNGNTTVTVTVDDAPLLIGSLYLGSAYVADSTISAIVIVSRKLTDTEHAELYGELESVNWPNKFVSRALEDVEEALSGAVQLKTDWGARETVSAVSTGFLSNTPFKVNSGTFNISTDTIDGKLCKVIECVTAGNVSIGIDSYMTPAAAAYGSFDLYVYHNSSSSDTRNNVLIGDTEDLSAVNGYSVSMTDTAISIQEYASGVASALFTGASGTWTQDSWNRVELTNSDADEKSVYLNGTLVDDTGGTGTNPVTDSTYTSGGKMIFDLKVGDKIALSDLTGDHSIIKHLGVV